MKRRFSIMVAVILGLFVLTTLGALNADWVYPSYPQNITGEHKANIGSFKYGQIYISEINITGGEYISASITKTEDTKISAEIGLSNNTASSVNADIVFYNATAVSYYYDKTELLSTDNEQVVFDVSGIAQKDEILSNTYKTITLTFHYDGNASVGELLGEINFKFSIDKDSIGEVVAETAIDRFGDILNNVVLDDSYEQLDNAMNNRDGGWNKGSAVTYIGNVVGADSDDSSVFDMLFGDDFMKADLDGDGTEEPITMMIKRENLDGDTSTGADYTYRGTWGDTVTVSGVEMTLYITSQQIGNADIVVYAATFTKLAGETEWVLLVPLTKGTAETNNYTGWGSANSFNTDTWRSDSGERISDLVAANS